jgi:hypothetical protein
LLFVIFPIDAPKVKADKTLKQLWLIVINKFIKQLSEDESDIEQFNFRKRQLFDTTETKSDFGASHKHAKNTRSRSSSIRINVFLLLAA